MRLTLRLLVGFSAWTVLAAGPASQDAQRPSPLLHESHKGHPHPTRPPVHLGTDALIPQVPGATVRSVESTDAFLDPTFGEGGRVVTDFGLRGGYDEANAVAVQADGKIVVAGYTRDITFQWDFAVARYLPDGTLDPAFGEGGRATTDFGGSDIGTEVVVALDGKIIVLGHSFGGSATRAVVARYLSDGTLDPTFGEGGRATAELEALRYVAGGGVQPDGKVFVVGYAVLDVPGDRPTPAAAAVRFLANGALDPTFSDGDWVTTDFQINGTPSAVIDDVVLLGDGRIVYVGSLQFSSQDAGDWQGLIGGYDPDGTVDASFSAGTGYLSFPLSASASYGTSVAVEPDGALVVAGYGSSLTGGGWDYAAARFSADGVPDQTYNGGRYLLWDAGSPQDFASSVVVRPDGSAVVVGTVGSGSGDGDVALVRITPDGSVDAEYGPARVDYGSVRDRSNDAAVFPDGSVVAVGRSSADFALARFLPSGELDLSFGEGGLVKTDFDGEGSVLVEDVVTLADGGLIGAGSARDGQGSDIALVRYGPDGVLDPTFGDGGLVTADFGTEDDFGESVAVSPDGSIYVVGTSAVSRFDEDFALVRFRPDGTLDASFGDGGRATANYPDPIAFEGRTYNDAESLYILSDGSVLVGGCTDRLVLDDATGAYRFDHDFAVVRFRPDGTLDRSFGDDGWAIIDVTADETSLDQTTMAVDTDGNVVVGGRVFADGPDRFHLARLGASGVLDASYGDGGIAQVETLYGISSDIALGEDGSVLVPGFVGSTSSPGFAVTRYTSSGTLDRSFGDEGLVTIDFGGRDAAFDIESLENGAAIVAGQTCGSAGCDFALARLTETGALDLTYGDAGRVVTDLGGGDGAVAADVLPDGRIVLAGTSVRDDGGRSVALSRFVAEGTGPVAAVTVEGSPEAGANLSLAVMPARFAPTGGTLYYRASGAPSYSAVPLAQTGGRLGATVPAAAVTMRGLDYYAEVTDGSTTLTFPAADAAGRPAHVRVALPRMVSETTFPDGLRYRLASIPVDAPVGTADAVFGDDYGPYAPSRWRLFRWSPSEERNVEYAERPFSVTPGTGFWLIASRTFDVDSSRSASAGRPARLRLEPGWNQIASPFGFAIAWSGVEGAEAVSRPVAWDGAEYVFEQTVLEPWAGYFVENPTPEAITVTVPPIAASAARTAPSSAVPGYRLRLSAVSGDLRDTQNTLGFAAGAESGRDRLDLAEPPLPGDHVRLSIVEGDERLARSLRALPADGATWDVEVAASPELLRDGALSVRLAFDDLRALPPGFVRVVDDLDAGAVLDDATEIVLTEAVPTRRLRVVVGTAAYAASATALRTALGEPFPNPAAGRVTIPYRLGVRSHVTLDVFDALGRRVATLVDREFEAGSHEAVLDASLAAGVYIVRLGAGPFSAAGTLVITR